MISFMVAANGFRVHRRKGWIRSRMRPSLGQDRGSLAELMNPGPGERARIEVPASAG
ncbi:hypothetical protein [Labrys sp. KNU-23]|uniref:hypothetical protein n=1 Tax=Labrys sp. KNU-23 TaxID=2789216 RepID=UPI00165B2CC9|nr:hypothetical protein [Labrys sp. KNU-23]